MKYDLWAYEEELDRMFPQRSRQFMGFVLIIINPPYCKELFLQILRKLLPLLCHGGKMISVNPANWWEESEAVINNVHIQYRDVKLDLRRHVEEVQLIEKVAANWLFNIGSFTDMGFFVFSNTDVVYQQQPHKPLSQSIINKVLNYCNVNQSLSDAKWHRGEIPTNHCVQIRGMYSSNKGYHIMRYVPASGETNGDAVYFDTEVEARNFCDAYSTTIMRNISYMLSLNQHCRLSATPYLGDFKQTWTDVEIAKLLGFTEEEATYMMREVSDYNTKDFYNYVISCDTGGISYYPENSYTSVVASSDDNVSRSQPKKVTQRRKRLTTVSTHEVAPQDCISSEHSLLLEKQAFAKKVVKNIISDLPTELQDTLLKKLSTCFKRQQNALTARETRKRAKAAPPMKCNTVSVAAGVTSIIISHPKFYVIRCLVKNKSPRWLQWQSVHQLIFTNTNTHAVGKWLTVGATTKQKPTCTVAGISVNHPCIVSSRPPPTALVLHESHIIQFY